MCVCVMSLAAFCYTGHSFRLVNLAVPAMADMVTTSLRGPVSAGNLFSEESH